MIRTQEPPDTLVGTMAQGTRTPDGFLVESFGEAREFRVTLAPGAQAPEWEPERPMRLWGRMNEEKGLFAMARWEDPWEREMTVLVCGGRDFQGWDAVQRVLDRVAPDVIIHGAARGADSLAERYARENNIVQRAFPARWRRPDGGLDRGAGHRRNQQMLDEARPDLVLAFPGGPGTRDMTRRAREQGFPVQEYDSHGRRRYGRPEPAGNRRETGSEANRRIRRAQPLAR